jgi:hypothetical protein
MRTFGIWAFGLLGSGIIGGIIGSRFGSGWSDDSVPGFFAGVFVFACLRLWLGQSKISN